MERGGGEKKRKKGKKWEGVFIVGEENTHTNWGFR